MGSQAAATDRPTAVAMTDCQSWAFAASLTKAYLQGCKQRTFIWCLSCHAAGSKCCSQSVSVELVSILRWSEFSAVCGAQCCA